MIRPLADRKQAEVAFRRNGGDYRMIFERSPLGTFRTTFEGRLVEVNPSLAKMFGYDSPESMIREVHNVGEQLYVRAEERERIVADQMRETDVTHHVMRFRRRDGGELVANMYLKTVRNSDGHPVCLEGILEDITERKRLEERLGSLHRYALRLASATTLDEIVNHTLDTMQFNLGFALAEFDMIEDGMLVVKGSRGELGWSPPRRLEDLGIMPKAARELMSIRVDDTRKEPSYLDRMGPGRNASPTMLSELATPVVLDGRAIAVLNVEQAEFNAFSEQDQILLENLGAHVASEIRRKRVEDGLRRSEERYSVLFDRMLDGIYLSTHEGRFVDVNPAFVKMFGYSSKEEMLALPDIKKELYFSPEERGSHILDSGKEEVEVYRMRRRDGSEIWVEDHGRYIHDERGDVLYHEGILRDVTERVHSEQRLQLHAKITENMFEGLVLIRERDGVIVYTNSRFESMFGYDAGELIGKNISALNAPISGKSSDEVAREIQTELRKKGAWNGEILNVKKDGDRIWCQANVSALSSSEYGAIWVATHEDITERKKLEETLRLRAETLHSLQETLLEITGERDLPQLLNRIVERAAALLDAPGGGLYLCDPDRREVRCVVSYNTKVNAVGLVLKYGEGAAGVVAETGRPLITDDYRTWPKRAAYYEKEKPFGAVLSAPMIWQGRVIGVIHVLRYDLRRFTERDLDLLALFANHAAIAMENARLYDQLDEHANQLESIVKERTGRLAESEVRYRRLFESSPISLWEEDFSEVKRYFDELRGRGINDLRTYFIEHPEDVAKCASIVKVIDVNEATLELYGAKTVEELLGELNRVLTHESQGEPRFTEELVALGEGKTRFESEFDNQTLTGETRHVSLILNVVPGYESTLAKVLVSIIDLTERKEMEERLQQAERLAAVGETAAMVGHDLRNPLQGIAAAVHLLRQESLTPKEREEMLQVIERSLRYSDAIIRDLSDYAAEIQLRLAESTPKSMTQDALGSVRVPQNVLVRNLSEDNPTLRVDTERMKRVFVNLIENAIDAMPHGGTLTISSDRSYSGVEIAISDSGSGMAEKAMGNLFKPLQTTKAKGMGLGLAICKRVVDAHGGKISVRSKTGEGTTIAVLLPIQLIAVEVSQK